MLLRDGRRYSVVEAPVPIVDARAAASDRNLQSAIREMIAPEF